MSRLDSDVRKSLLTLARAAIGQALHHDRRLDDLLAATTMTAQMHEPRAVFVTVRSRAGAGERLVLRGCLGSLVAKSPLYRAVIETAPRSALEDPRFEPIAAEELDRVRIEISVLSLFVPLARIEDLILGRHGVHLACGGARSVFLPHVAVEQGWTAEQLLRELSRKAGLAPDAWKRADLSSFEAEVFAEA